MLTEHTLTKLQDMKLAGMLASYERMQADPRSCDLAFEERFAMLVDGEWLHQQNRALARRLGQACLRQQASIENIDWRAPRGLKPAVVDQLATCDWIRYGQNCIITGATGLGKSWLACALAEKACREGYRTLYQYAPRMFREMLAAEVGGTFTKLVRKLARVDLLVIDDWGMETAERHQYRALLEVLDERCGSGSVLVTSQYPDSSWHAHIGEPTVADAILDRLVHNAYKIQLKGERSMREHKTG